MRFQPERVIAAIFVGLLSAELWFGFGSRWLRDRPVPVDLGAVPTAEPDRVAFVAIGDAGDHTRTLDEVAARMKAWCGSHVCDFGVLLGDNLYPRGLQSDDDPRFTEVLAPLALRPGFRWYATLGNHDYGNSTEESFAEHELAYARTHPDFVLPAPTYAFTAGPARFAVIDTTDIFWHGDGAQGAFLDGLPDDKPARVLVGHHPYKSDGPHGNAGSYEGASDVPWLSGQALQQFYERYGCARFALGLTGHDHVRERIDACGTTWVVSGAAAKPTEVVPRGNQPAFVSAEPGFAYVTIDARGVIDVQFPEPAPGAN